MILRSNPQSLSIRDVMKQHDMSNSNNNILAELQQPRPQPSRHAPPPHIESQTSEQVSKLQPYNNRDRSTTPRRRRIFDKQKTQPNSQKPMYSFAGVTPSANNTFHNTSFNNSGNMYHTMPSIGQQAGNNSREQQRPRGIALRAGNEYSRDNALMGLRKNRDAPVPVYESDFYRNTPSFPQGGVDALLRDFDQFQARQNEVQPMPYDVPKTQLEPVMRGADYNYPQPGWQPNQMPITNNIAPVQLSPFAYIEREQIKSIPRRFHTIEQKVRNQQQQIQDLRRRITQLKVQDNDAQKKLLTELIQKQRQLNAKQREINNNLQRITRMQADSTIKQEQILKYELEMERVKRIEKISQENERLVRGLIKQQTMTPGPVLRHEYIAPVLRQIVSNDYSGSQPSNYTDSKMYNFGKKDQSYQIGEQLTPFHIDPKIY